MDEKIVSKKIGAEKLYIETGRMAKQADGAAIVRYGGTVVLGTVVASKEPDRQAGFLPLSVEYREKTYAAGKIPGGFFKREGRPTEKEILSARLIDRPLRPLFPKGFFNPVQIMVMVLSADQENDPDTLGLIAASCAISLSDIPLTDIPGAVRVGRLGGEYIIFPTHKQIDDGDIEIVVAGIGDSVIMLEGGGKEIKNEHILEAINSGLEASKEVSSLIKELTEKCGKKKREIELIRPDRELEQSVKEFSKGKIEEVLAITDNTKREEFIEELLEKAKEELQEEDPSRISDIRTTLDEVQRELLRNQTLRDKKRIDGRSPEQPRPVTCEVSMLPRTHGSALFTRGETQSLAVATLGTAEDEQILDELRGESSKSFMLHYNFPPFSVGEIKPIRGPGRREVGHGALAERALKPVLPSNEEFPYTIRIVSDILESNGSSSMATVCGACLALMDAGVPIKAPVCGVAIGIIREGAEVILLTDITGPEDHFGDMDFKVAGTEKGITAIQLDMKITGIDCSIIERILEVSSNGREKILNEMLKVIPEPREKISEFAPSITVIKVKPDKIKDIIGPSGRTIRNIIERTGVQIDIKDDGKVSVASPDVEKLQEAIRMIEALTAEAEVGKIYSGKVKKITDFGAFVEILPGQEGLVHISQLADYHVKKVEDIVRVGEKLDVKVIAIDNQGRINLSRKAVLKASPGM